MINIKEKILHFFSTTSMHLKIYCMVIALAVLVSGISLLFVRYYITETLTVELDQSLQSIGSDAAAESANDSGGAARVGLRENLIRQSLHKVTVQMLLTLLGVIGLAAFIVLGLTTILTQPIQRLLQLTKKVAAGDLSTRISSYPNDEIGKLSASFNQMLDSLEESEKEKTSYYEKVMSRNRELSLLNILSENVKTYDEMRALLQKFIICLVSELDVNSVVITIKLDQKIEQFQHAKRQCTALTNTGSSPFEGKCICEMSGNKVFKKIDLILERKNVGDIYICHCEAVDQYTLNIVQSISKQLTVMLENIFLWNEIKKKEQVRIQLIEKIMSVQEEERKRIARELHDETSHSLSSILLGLRGIQDENHPLEHIKKVHELRELTEQAIKDVHDLAWQLRPSILDKFGLSIALERYVEEYASKSSLQFDLLIRGLDGQRLSPKIETAIFRIVQESLTNIFKYAEAAHVSVVIIKQTQFISVVIEDDGQGFDVEAVLARDVTKDNLGLYGMKERVMLLDGNLTIESKINEGTIIFVKIPM